MKVGIIGAGSLGLLFAAYLSRAFETIIYTRTPAQAEQINQNGIVLKKGDTVTSTNVQALPISDWKGTETVTVVAVKQYHLHTIIENVNSSAAPNLLFIQNGMGHLKLLEAIKEKNIAVGSVEHGALRENAYTVYHNGEGITNAASYKGTADWLHFLAAKVPNDFPIVIRKNYFDMMQKKLIVNAAINPLTAILRVKNGDLIENPYYLQALNNLFEEISDVLRLGDKDAYLQHIHYVCQSTAENRSSMLKDLEAGRMTEVDAILGYLLDEAEKLNKQAAQIQGLYSLIKGKEQEGRSEKF